MPSRETQHVIKAIAAALTPATLELVVADLDWNDQETEYMQKLADFAKRNFNRQLKCITGHDALAAN